MSNIQPNSNGQDEPIVPTPEDTDTSAENLAQAVVSDSTTGSVSTEAGGTSAASNTSVATSVPGAPCPSLDGQQNVDKPSDTAKVLGDLSKKLEQFTIEAHSSTSMVVHVGSQPDVVDVVMQASAGEPKLRPQVVHTRVKRFEPYAKEEKQKGPEQNIVLSPEKHAKDKKANEMAMLKSMIDENVEIAKQLDKLMALNFPPEAESESRPCTATSEQWSSDSSKSLIQLFVADKMIDSDSDNSTNGYLSKEKASDHSESCSSSAVDQQRERGASQTASENVEKEEEAGEDQTEIDDYDFEDTERLADDVD